MVESIRLTLAYIKYLRIRPQMRAVVGCQFEIFQQEQDVHLQIHGAASTQNVQ
jgi:hypothetical protein